eukprot:s1989_g2.t1
MQFTTGYRPQLFLAAWKLHVSCQPIRRLPWFLAALGLPIVRADGELFLSSTSPAPVLAPVGIGPGNVTVDARQCIAHSFAMPGAKCSGGFGDIAQLRIFMRFSFGMRGVNGDLECPGWITDLTASTATGHGGSAYIPDNAIDGSSNTFFAGDHDIGMSCHCWESSKKDRFGRLAWYWCGSVKTQILICSRYKFHQISVGKLIEHTFFIDAGDLEN